MKYVEIEKIVNERIQELKDMEKYCKTETGQEKFYVMRKSLEIMLDKIKKEEMKQQN